MNETLTAILADNLLELLVIPLIGWAVSAGRSYLNRRFALEIDEKRSKALIAAIETGIRAAIEAKLTNKSEIREFVRDYVPKSVPEAVAHFPQFQSVVGALTDSKLAIIRRGDPDK
jgi:hypothetical protein